MFVFVSIQYKIDCRVTIELLDTESDDTEKCVANTQAWSNYVERLANPAASATSAQNAASGSAANTPSGVGRALPGSGNGVGSGGVSGNGVEIKTEKPDDEMVSKKFLTNITE